MYDRRDGGGRRWRDCFRVCVSMDITMTMIVMYGGAVSLVNF